MLAAVLAGCGGSGDGPAPANQTADARNPSVARQWNEALLDAIRKDLARPTVHARNLFHVSAAMYDAWALYSDTARPYLAGGAVHGFTCPMTGFKKQGDLQLVREEAISFAAYRIIQHRFATSPGAAATMAEADALMSTLGYDAANTSTDLSDGSAAAVGNRIAECYINYGLQDGANEADGYKNQHYLPVNAPIEPPKPGNPNITDLDRWQPIALVQYVDQAGNVINSQPPALSPEWGAVLPFSLSDADKTTFNRDGFGYNVYHDPGPPPRAQGTDADIYKWAFALVAVWSGQLDQDDGVMIDISPASNGNVAELPATFEEYPAFYDLLNGGDLHTGHTVNPATGAPYAPQIVPRGDYTRVLAEFWADGPTSETPPGHWFTILNTVTDHPLFHRRVGGAGPELGPLEWDVKAYFTLGGTMHDVAITAWGIKGWYDCIRPISAIRAMADRGQSSDPVGPSYHPDGIPLVPGHIEVVQAGDPLAGACERERRQDQALRLARTDRDPGSADDPGPCRLDPGGELVAVPAADLRDAAVSRLYLGALHLFARSRRGDDAADGRRVLPRRHEPVRDQEEPVPGVRGWPERRHDVAVGDVSRRGRAERPVAHLGRHPSAHRRRTGTADRHRDRHLGLRFRERLLRLVRNKVTLILN